MDDLYLGVKSANNEDSFYESVHSAITLFVLESCQSDEQLQLLLVTESSTETVPFKLSCKLLSKKPRWLLGEDIPDLARICDLPVIVCKDTKLVISGLCSVLRHIVRTTQKGSKPSQTDSDRFLHNLLGLRENCLRACAEVSEWTMYCEVTLPQLVDSVLHRSYLIGSLPPSELLQIENELSKPAVEPSCRARQKQRSSKYHSASAKTTEKRGSETCIGGARLDKCREHQSSDGSNSTKFADVSESFRSLRFKERSEEICGRSFVEGNNVQLTDLVLFICVRLLFTVPDTTQWCAHLPRLVSWYRRMAAIPDIAGAADTLGLFVDVLQDSLDLSAGVSSTSVSATSEKLTVESSRVDEAQFSGTVLPASPLSEPNESIYGHTADTGQFSGTIVADGSFSDSKTIKSDPSCIQHLEKTKFHASQALVDAGIAKATNAGLLPDVLPLGGGTGCLRLPWAEFPSWVLPFGVGGVPDKRATRKLNQLENIAAAVCQLVAARSRDAACPGRDVIVDFCAGGGHVGILLAYLFPRYKVLLVENKEESVRRAVERISTSGADNMAAVQCNLGRFNSPFAIGVSLHACGLATDLVMAKCLAASASFVISPCCYGALRNSGPFVDGGSAQEIHRDISVYESLGPNTFRVNIDGKSGAISSEGLIELPRGDINVHAGSTLNTSRVTGNDKCGLISPGGLIQVASWDTSVHGSPAQETPVVHNSSDSSPFATGEPADDAISDLGRPLRQTPDDKSISTAEMARETNWDISDRENPSRSTHVTAQSSVDFSPNFAGGTTHKNQRDIDNEGSSAQIVAVDKSGSQAPNLSEYTTGEGRGGCSLGVRTSSTITYPRSETFRSAGFDYVEYLSIGHAADQTQPSIVKSAQGRTCMTIVDSDRCQYAEQLGFTAQLYVMAPSSCSPKNHVIVCHRPPAEG